MINTTQTYSCEDCGAPAGAPCADDSCPSYFERLAADRDSLDDALEDDARMAWIEAGRPNYWRGRVA